MPLYVYRCTFGHEIEKLVKLDKSNAPERCDAPVAGTQYPCDAQLKRVMTAPAEKFPGADSWRTK